jgi:hypothetical protein
MTNKETVRINKKQMNAWRPLESEHSRVKTIQERIVHQHVNEHGIGYYPALRKMEAGLKKK